MSFLVSSLLWAGLWLLLTPGELLAWGPATHIAIGEAVLASSHLLPPAVRTVIEKYRTPFLYGSVAADISFAKKYAPAGRHCHHWHVGEEIHREAETEELQAVGLGYLSHLAADTVAHNFYVPRRLLITSTTPSVGHTYWEHRMDVHLGERFLRQAREVVLRHDHTEADELMDRVLSRTLFSFRTNRRIFRGMVAFQDDERWKQVFRRILRSSRFDLPEALRNQYIRLSYDYVMEYLTRGEDARAARLDPIGESHLKSAKRARREGLAEPGSEDPEFMREWADRFFPLPDGPLLFVPRAPRVPVPGLWLPPGFERAPEADDQNSRSSPA
jgi:hypothetical protein